MNLHHFSTTHEGSRMMVIMGWHRPLRHMFMIIERNPPDDIEGSADADDDGCILYSNLNDPGNLRMDLADFKKKLAEFGIQVPDSMFEQTARDQELNIENRHVWHSADGSFQEI